MVKSTSLQNSSPSNGSTATKPQRRRSSGGGLIFLLLLLLAVSLGLAGVGLFAPTRLAIAQEQTLGLLNGGIMSSTETTYVDGCVRIPGADQPQAITRTRRSVVFRNGTTLEIVFSGRPAPTNVQCP